MEPHLRRGAHPSADAGSCLMEHVSRAAGEPFGDRPRCTHPALAALAQQVNDRVSDAARDDLLPLVPALARTASDDPAAAWRLVAVCARHALAVRPDDRTATRLLGRASRAEARWARVPLRGAAGRIASLRALPDLTAALHRVAVLAGEPGSVARDTRLVGMLADAVETLATEPGPRDVLAA